MRKLRLWSAAFNSLDGCFSLALHDDSILLAFAGSRADGCRILVTRAVAAAIRTEPSDRGTTWIGSGFSGQETTMAFPIDPSQRQPKGDHNRRLALGLDPDVFALEAGVTVEQLREYELTSPDQDFDLDVARRVGFTLERLEANPPPSQKVVN
jgi:hypothetical protein